jgi:hypothetical protein
MMRNIVGSLIITMMIVGCGGGGNMPSSSLNNQENIEQQSITIDEQKQTPNTIAKDNTLKDVVKSFRSYQIKVLTDKQLDKDAVSNSTFALYGEVDGENTAALLKLNSNYPLGTKIVIKVYDYESKKLAGESEVVTLNGEALNFGVIELD